MDIKLYVMMSFDSIMAEIYKLWTPVHWEKKETHFGQQK